MGFNRLPKFTDYWSHSEYLGVRGVYKCMTSSKLWRRLHVFDNDTRSDSFHKVRPIINRLKETFTRAYNPAHELLLNETMIKCKGRARSKVYMPKKPIKHGFKMDRLSCVCCGYLCDFHLCSGKQSDQDAGKKLGKPEKVADAVKKLLIGMYGGETHVVNMDRFFPNGPLVNELRKEKI